MTTTLHTQYKTDHIDPTLEAWHAFETAALGGEGDSITAYIHYRTLLKRADRASSGVELMATINDGETYEAAMKAVNAYKAELERITTEIRYLEKAKRSTAGVFDEEIEAANTALNEIADSIGSDTRRSANDLGFVNAFNYVKPRLKAGEVRSGFGTIPNHGSLHNALEHIITQQAK